MEEAVATAATGAEATLTSEDAESITLAGAGFFFADGFFAVEDDFALAGFLVLEADVSDFFLLFDMLPTLLTLTHPWGNTSTDNCIFSNFTIYN
ncbi:MAG: hypothetical protein ACKOKF_09115 [Bacteroidota bacterium]